MTLPRCPVHGLALEFEDGDEDRSIFVCPCWRECRTESVRGRPGWTREDQFAPRKGWWEK